MQCDKFEVTLNDYNRNRKRLLVSTNGEIVIKDCSSVESKSRLLRDVVLTRIRWKDNWINVINYVDLLHQDYNVPVKKA